MCIQLVMKPDLLQTSLKSEDQPAMMSRLLDVVKDATLSIKATEIAQVAMIAGWVVCCHYKNELWSPLKLVWFQLGQRRVTESCSDAIEYSLEFMAALINLQQSEKSGTPIPQMKRQESASLSEKLYRAPVTKEIVINGILSSPFSGIRQAMCNGIRKFCSQFQTQGVPLSVNPRFFFSETLLSYLSKVSGERWGRGIVMVHWSAAYSIAHKYKHTYKYKYKQGKMQTDRGEIKFACRHEVLQPPRRDQINK